MSSLRVGVGAIAAWALWLAFSGCAPQAGACQVSGDCPSGQLCFQGTCHITCVSDDECPLGYCDLGVCHTGTPLPFTPPDDGGASRDVEGPPGDGGAPGGDGGGPDAGPPDAGTRDGGSGDDAGNDGGNDDAGLLDAGLLDAGLLDAGLLDAGLPDAGPLDAGPADPCAATDPYGADLDGDCLPDLVVGAPAIAAAPGTGTGREATVSVLLGQADGDFSPLGGFLTGTATHGRFGAALALDEHKDANGKRGFLVGEENPFGTGAVHRFTLSADDVLTDDVVAAPTGVSGFGAAVALAGGSSAHASALGVGAREQPSAPAQGVGWFAFAPDPGALRSGAGVEYTPADLAPGATGQTPRARVARVPDQDGDGRSDFAISGAGLSDGGGPLGVTLVSSSTLEIVGTLPLPPGEGASFGAYIAALPDYDGDGVGEIAVSAPENGAGRVYVAYSTRTDYLTVVPPPQVTAQGRFGAAVAVAGDFDGDGLDDLAIGSPFHIRVFPPPADGEPDQNAALDECAALRGAGYTGNCAGHVSLFFGAVLEARAVGGAATEAAVACLHGGAGGRMGTSLRALGPSPATGAMRLAYGAPGLSDRASYLGIFTGTADDNGCTGDINSFTVRDANDVPVNGVFLGYEIAR